jgi:hypothetical protein
MFFPIACFEALAASASDFDAVAEVDFRFPTSPPAEKISK